MNIAVRPQSLGSIMDLALGLRFPVIWNICCWGCFCWWISIVFGVATSASALVVKFPPPPMCVSSVLLSNVLPPLLAVLIRFPSFRIRSLLTCCWFIPLSTTNAHDCAFTKRKIASIYISKQKASRETLFCLPEPKSWNEIPLITRLAIRM